MLIKRSVSPDGRIDSLSVEFDCPVEEQSLEETVGRARKILELQREIVGHFEPIREVRRRRPRTFEGQGDVSVRRRKRERRRTRDERIGGERVFEQVDQAVVVRVGAVGGVARIVGRAEECLPPRGARLSTGR